MHRPWCRAQIIYKDVCSFFYLVDSQFKVHFKVENLYIIINFAWFLQKKDAFAANRISLIILLKQYNQLCRLLNSVSCAREADIIHFFYVMISKKRKLPWLYFGAGRKLKSKQIVLRESKRGKQMTEGCFFSYVSIYRCDCVSSPSLSVCNYSPTTPQWAQNKDKHGRLLRFLKLNVKSGKSVPKSTIVHFRRALPCACVRTCVCACVPFDKNRWFILGITHKTFDISSV